MKKEMSSFDVRSIVTEMAVLEGGHMDKIYHWGAGNVLFRINVQGEGKKELFFKDKKWLYCPAVKPETPTLPTSFASFLRKYIDNARIGKVRQIGFDRIVEMELSKSDGDYRLIFEMFGGGNVLLVKDGTILNCLIQKTWKDRKTRPGEPYLMPKTRFDPTESSEEDFLTSFRSSDSDCVRTLATSVNLGGQYAEEVCRRVGIDKSVPGHELPAYRRTAPGSPGDLVTTDVHDGKFDSGLLVHPVQFAEDLADETVSRRHGDIHYIIGILLCRTIDGGVA